MINGKQENNNNKNKRNKKNQDHPTSQLKLKSYNNNRNQQKKPKQDQIVKTQPLNNIPQQLSQSNTIQQATLLVPVSDTIKMIKQQKITNSENIIMEKPVTNQLNSFFSLMHQKILSKHQKIKQKFKSDIENLPCQVTAQIQTKNEQQCDKIIQLNNYDNQFLLPVQSKTWNQLQQTDNMKEQFKNPQIKNQTINTSNNIRISTQIQQYEQTYNKSSRKIKTQVTETEINKIYQPKIIIQGPENHQTKIKSNMLKIKKKNKDSNHKHQQVHLSNQGSQQKYHKNCLQQIEQENQFHDLLTKAQLRRKSLQKRLEQLNSQIKNMENPEQIVEVNSRRRDLSINHNLKSKPFKLSKLRQQRQTEFSEMEELFTKLDDNILQTLSELQKIRNQREQKSKQKKKIQILQRMKKQQRLKQEQSKLREQNIQFLNSLKKNESKRYILQNHNKKNLKQSRQELPLINIVVKKEVIQPRSKRKTINHSFNRELLTKK